MIVAVVRGPTKHLGAVRRRPRADPRRSDHDEFNRQAPDVPRDLRPCGLDRTERLRGAAAAKAQPDRPPGDDADRASRATGPSTAGASATSFDSGTAPAATTSAASATSLETGPATSTTSATSLDSGPATAAASAASSFDTRAATAATSTTSFDTGSATAAASAAALRVHLGSWSHGPHASGRSCSPFDVDGASSRRLRSESVGTFPFRRSFASLDELRPTLVIRSSLES